MAWLSPRSRHPPRSGVCPAANRNSGRQDTLRPPPPSSLCPGEGLCCFGRAQTFCVLPDLNPFRFLEAPRTNLPVLLVAAGRGNGSSPPLCLARESGRRIRARRPRTGSRSPAPWGPVPRQRPRSLALSMASRVAASSADCESSDTANRRPSTSCTCSIFPVAASWGIRTFNAISGGSRVQRGLQ